MTRRHKRPVRHRGISTLISVHFAGALGCSQAMSLTLYLAELLLAGNDEMKGMYEGMNATEDTGRHSFTLS